MKTKLYHIIGSSGFAIVIGWFLRGIITPYFQDQTVLTAIGLVALCLLLFFEVLILKGIYGDTLS